MNSNQIFGRLCVGTANWGKEYNGSKVSEDDQKRILDYCRQVGIDMIDTATAYEWDWTKIDPFFKVVVKVITGDESKEIKKYNPYCIMRHDTTCNLYCTCCNGASLYEPRIITKPEWAKVIQVPYSLYDRRFEWHIKEYKSQGIEIHVRSVFLRGKLIEDGYSPFACISFCLMNPYVDRVILGADSFEQFEGNLDIFRRMCEAQKDDIELLDPRKWKDEK